MAETTTITVRISMELKAKLDRIAKAMERSRSYIAEEALAIYARSEIETLEGLEQAMTDVEAGRFFTAEQMQQEFDKLVAETHSEPRRKKAAGA